MLTDDQAYFVTFLIYLFLRALTATANYRKWRKQSCTPNKNVNHYFSMFKCLRSSIGTHFGNSLWTFGLHGIFGERTYNHGTVLQWIIGQIQWGLERDMAAVGKEKSALPPWQRTTSSVMQNLRGQITWLYQQLLSHLPCSSQMATCNLFLFVPRHENLAREKRIQLKQDHHRDKQNNQKWPLKI